MPCLHERWRLSKRVGHLGSLVDFLHEVTLAKGLIRLFFLFRVQEIALEISIFDGGLWKLLLLAALA